MINLLGNYIDKCFDGIFEQIYSKEIVVFCAGNHKVWYDSFGPLLAEKLRELNIDCFVYGGVNNTIMPDNLIEFMNFVEKKHPYAKVFVVDNCLAVSNADHLSLKIKNASTLPAFLSNDKLFGNYSILLNVDPGADSCDYLERQAIVIDAIAKKLQFYIQKMRKNTKIAANFANNVIKMHNN